MTSWDSFPPTCGNWSPLRRRPSRFPSYYLLTLSLSPPFCICEAQCQPILSDLGYHIVYYDLDTQGYLKTTAEDIQQSKDIVDKALASSSPAADAWLHIEHDIHYHVVYSLMDYMLEQVSSKGWNMVTVGQCLGDPEALWYRSVDGDSVRGSALKTTARISADGRCGNGITCRGSAFGDCCSQYGYCGWSTAYCGYRLQFRLEHLHNLMWRQPSHQHRWRGKP